MAVEMLDLEKQFAFYAAYHSNKINILIHTLFVWPIILTVMFLIAFSKPIVPSPQFFEILPQAQYMVLNWSFVFTTVYVVYYVLLDRKAGLLAGAMCIACWLGSNAFAKHVPFSLGWKIVLCVQLICWMGQLVGHFVFERRAPAFLDNFFQAFLMGPYFVLLEVLQTVFHYEPYPGFKKNVRAKVRENLARHNEDILSSISK
ncbi:hypothetical protein O6H91_12G051900 [Diphasiastrum complanatum]|uniref:Uncharacterized protein n=2 Tax=Diphasiastrum complanatum TaxID=34168 RepID=A0ACC2C0E8_DIPCM|nr:hypothetical protein O6H91_12G037800 [Diphasiastrum complanatum]KAJ7535966.1 hypothetical protein O6H91_12G051900 [Diphasiastrum complanatum]